MPFILIAFPFINSLASLLLLAAPTSITKSIILSAVTLIIGLPENISSISFAFKSLKFSVNRISDNLTALSYSSLPCKSVMIQRARALWASLSSGAFLFFFSYSLIFFLVKKLIIFK